MNIRIILAEALTYFYYFLTILIFVRCIISWFPVNRDNFILKFVYNITEPILGPIRRLLDKSPIGGYMIDFSPIVAYILLQIIVSVLIQLVLSIGV